MGGAGDFLAGLLGGLGETYGAAMLEKRRIDLTKKQLENQNRQFEMQLAATKENTAAQLSLQRELGLKGIAVDERRVAVQEKGLDWSKEAENKKMEWETWKERFQAAARRKDQAAMTAAQIKIQELHQQWQSAENKAAREAQFDLRSLDHYGEIELLNIKEEIQNRYARLTGQDLEGQMTMDRYKAALELTGQLVANGMMDAKDAQASAKRIAENVGSQIILTEKDPEKQKSAAAAAATSIAALTTELRKTSGGRFSSPESSLALQDALEVLNSKPEKILEALGQKTKLPDKQVDLRGAQNVLGGMGSKARNGVGPIKDANAPITDDEIPGPLRVVPKYGIDEVDPYPSRAPKPSGGAATRPFRGRR